MYTVGPQKLHFPPSRRPCPSFSAFFLATVINGQALPVNLELLFNANHHFHSVSDH
jgi:hypothetical protein